MSSKLNRYVCHRVAGYTNIRIANNVLILQNYDIGHLFAPGGVRYSSFYSLYTFG